MAFEAVIFDLGGVLVTREPQRVVERIARERRTTPESVAKTVSESELMRAFERGQIDARTFHARLMRLLSLSWSFEAFVEAWNGILSEDADATRLLPALCARYRLGVLSNTNELHEVFIRGRWPVFGLIEHWVASYRVGLMKPEPEIYRLMLRQVGVEPQAAVYVDDTRENVEAARRLGLTAIHLIKGLSLAHELRRVGVVVDAA